MFAGQEWIKNLPSHMTSCFIDDLSMEHVSHREKRGRTDDSFVYSL